MKEKKVTISQQFPEYADFFVNPDSTDNIVLVERSKIVDSSRWETMSFENKLDFIDILKLFDYRGQLTLCEFWDGNISKPKKNKYYLGKLFTYVINEQFSDFIDSQFEKELEEIETGLNSCKTRAQKLNYINKRLIELRFEYGVDKNNKTNAVIDYLTREKKYWEIFIEEEETKTTFPIDLKWEGSKYEIAELIFSLWKSEKILKDNKPINQKYLIKTFEDLFKIDLANFSDILRDGLNSYKRSEDEKYFLKELLDFIEEKTNELRNRN